MYCVCRWQERDADVSWVRFVGGKEVGRDGPRVCTLGGMVLHAEY